jgi:sulfate adenylyltransferase subunit 2
MAMRSLTQIERLEAQSIHNLLKAVAQAENPLMLFSVAMDSSVKLHLAQKALHPAPSPLAMLHVISSGDLADLLGTGPERQGRANTKG